MRIELKQFSTISAFIDSARELIIKTGLESIAEREYFTFILSGGKTPVALYESLTDSGLSDSIPWDKTYLFLGDERLTANGEKNRNANMINQKLISSIAIPPENIIFPDIDSAKPDWSARAYEKQIKRFFKQKEFSFDLALLGLGEDGHTASLFPGDNSKDDMKHLVVSTSKSLGNPMAFRISMGYKALNSTRKILFLITGNAKKPIMEKVINDINKKDYSRYPAARIRPREELYFYTVF